MKPQGHYCEGEKEDVGLYFFEIFFMGYNSHLAYDELCDLGQNTLSLRACHILCKMGIVTSDRVVVRLNLDNTI